MTITVPIKVVSEANARGHWAGKARRTKYARETVALLMRQPLAMRREALAATRNGGAGVVVVTLTRIAPRELDDDNLRGALKACRDGVADALGIDDRDARVTWEYAQRRGKPREYAVEINVRAA